MKTTRALILFESSREDLPDPVGDDTVIPDGIMDELLRAYFLDAVSHTSALRGIEFRVYARSISSRDSLPQPWRELAAVQHGESVGARVADAFGDLFEEGFKHVILLASHAPLYAHRLLASAWTVLDAFDDAVVVGGASDGSCVALGARNFHDVAHAVFEQCKTLSCDTVFETLPAADTMLLTLPTWPGPRSLAQLSGVLSRGDELSSSSPDTADAARHESNASATASAHADTARTDATERTSPPPSAGRGGTAALAHTRAVLDAYPSLRID